MKASNDYSPISLLICHHLCHENRFTLQLSMVITQIGTVFSQINTLYYTDIQSVRLLNTVCIIKSHYETYYNEGE